MSRLTNRQRNRQLLTNIRHRKPIAEAKQVVPSTYRRGFSFFGKHDLWDLVCQWDERLCVWCRRMEQNDPYVGSYVRQDFPYLDVASPDLLKANIHPRCRCLLRRVGG